MKIKTVEISKTFKKGLPNYSNVTVSMGLSVEIAEDETPDYNGLWDIVNQQLTIQTNSNDQSWLQTEQTKDKYKFTIRTPKQGGEKNEQQ